MGHEQQRMADDPLGFIRRCVREHKVFWTHHVNMRLRGRSISRDEIVRAVATYEIIESYPEDKYLPSYLVYGVSGDTIFHVLFAVDTESDNVRIVTAYRPNHEEWAPDLRTRRMKS